MEVRNQSEAVYHYVRAAKLGLAVQNQVAELRLRAERRIGKFLHGLDLRGGDRKSANRRECLKLDDLEISQNESKRWQRLAAICDQSLNEFVKYTREHQLEISAAGFLRFAKRSTHGPSASQKVGPQHLRAARRQTNGNGAASSHSASVVEDVLGHLKLLQSLFESLCQDTAIAIKPMHRRTIRRYLNESIALLRELHDD